MGRAYEVRKASIQKTGAIKGKLYSNYAKEIYQAAKTGGVESNDALKRLIDKAKKDQVPSDIIKRAIDKVSSGVDENYIRNNYEIFGPGNSTVIIECLTDNVNRSVSNLRTVINKCHIKMGAVGSVSYLYEHLCIVSFKGLTEEETLDILLEKGVDVIDIENDNDQITVYAEPTELFKIKNSIKEKLPNVVFDIDEITMLAKEKIELNDEELEQFKKMIEMFEEVEDVSNLYYNVKNV